MKVIRNYLYSIGYQVLNMILPLITGPYVARVLGPKGVGINTYTGAVVQYFVLFGGLGVVLYGNREIAYVKDNKEKMSVTFWEIQLLKSLTVTIAYMAFVLYLLATHNYRNYLLIQSLYIIATGFDISWLYEGMENFKVTFTRNTLVRIVSFILILLFVRGKSDVGIYIAILAISNLLGYIAMWPIIKDLVFLVPLRKIHPLKHIKGLLSLFFPYIALNLYPVINKTLLERFSGIDASGFYEKSDVIIRMALTIVTSIGLVLLPHTSIAYAEGKKKLVRSLLIKSFSITSMIGFPVAFGMASIAPKFGLFFYGNGFGPVGFAMFIESFAIIFMGWSGITGNQYLIPTNQNIYYTYSVILGSLMNIILDFPLIKLWGLNGAAVATVISEAFIALFQLFIVTKQVKIIGFIKDLLKYLFSSLVMFSAITFISMKMHMNIFTLLIYIITGGCIYGVLIILLKPSGVRSIYSFINRKFYHSK